MQYNDKYPFVHLRVHSSYSLSEGAIKINEIASLCKKNDMPAMALTDSGNLFAALEFSENMKKNGIQPIIGTETNLILHEDDEESGIMILIAKDQTGYNNLIKMVSKSYVEAKDVHKPTISLAELKEKNEGIIMLTGGHKGLLSQYICSNRKDEADSLTKELKSIFDDRLYIELERHDIEEEIISEPVLIEMAYKYDVPLVATNNCMFPIKEMYEAQDILTCIAKSAYVSDTERDNYTQEHYFKSSKEMIELFADIPEAISNTVAIAHRCHIKSEPHAPMLPNCETGSGRDEASEFAYIAREGLKERLDNTVYPRELTTWLNNPENKDKEDSLPEEQKEEISKRYFERLEYEIGIITQMEFPGYFLIVSDFIKWSKDNDIPVGPGRGSGAGSLVAWSMKITDLDPIFFGLLFERFLNPERVSMPDFDIDFCQERREEVIHYVQQKYGTKQVAQIITFGKLQARAVVRDVGRVLQMSYSHTDRICKMIPNNPANPLTLQEAIDLDPELRREAKNDEQVGKLLDIGLKLEGMHRHCGTHAAGVVIGSLPLDEVVPLYRDPRSQIPATQFSMKYAEMAGLVKFDFLGLKTLTQIKNACSLVVSQGNEIDIDHIPMDDKSTFTMLSKGDSTGVFQMESAGMRDALRKMKPDNIEDIIALISLYRPGPMENIPTYIARKHGKEEPDYLHPNLEKCLKETFGVIIYQEQVMEIAQVLSGYTLGGADLLRRAMGKKIKAEMDKQRELFVEGAKNNNVDPNQAGGIFDLVAKFAGYGFNKSHAAAYAWIGYQTAYLKANYPVEFLTACLNIDIGDTDKLNIFVNDAEYNNIAILPPCVNASSSLFTVEDLPKELESKYSNKKAIRYGLGALKGAGIEAMNAMIECRKNNGNKFADIFDFSRSCTSSVMNKRQLESLAKAGAFESIHKSRRQIFEAVIELINYNQMIIDERESSQANLFGNVEDQEPPASILPKVSDWENEEKLSYEKEAIGFYLTAHPLDNYKKHIGGLGIIYAANLDKDLPHGKSSCRLAGMITAVSIKAGNKGRFAYITISDPTGITEIGLFNESLILEYKELFSAGRPIIAYCETRKDEGGTRVMCDSIEYLSDNLENKYKTVQIEMGDISNISSLSTLISEPLEDEEYCKQNISLRISTKHNVDVVVKLSDKYYLSYNDFEEVEKLSGIKALKIS